RLLLRGSFFASGFRFEPDDLFLHLVLYRNESRRTLTSQNLRPLSVPVTSFSPSGENTMQLMPLSSAVNSPSLRPAFISHRDTTPGSRLPTNVPTAKMLPSGENAMAPTPCGPVGRVASMVTLSVFHNLTSLGQIPPDSRRPP